MIALSEAANEVNMPERTLPSVPGYDEVVDRNDIEILRNPVDLTVRNGDIAVTKRGDLMLNDEDCSAFFSLVNGWRYNYPVVKVLFDTVFQAPEENRRIEQGIEGLFAAAAKHAPHHMDHMDYEEYHRLNDDMGANEAARGVYAGTIAVLLTKMLQSFVVDIAATKDDWKAASPLIEGHSVGQILEVSANNVRHADEWQVTRPPSEQQLRSLRVLASVLKEPLDPPDGSRHRFSREVSPETLQVISGGDFESLERNVFSFAKNLLKLRTHRKPSQSVM